MRVLCRGPQQPLRVSTTGRRVQGLHRTQVLKDPENKRKVLERTPMKRVGEVEEVSGGPGCRGPQHVITPIVTSFLATAAAVDWVQIISVVKLQLQLPCCAGVVAFLCSPAASYVTGDRRTMCILAVTT